MLVARLWNVYSGLGRLALTFSHFVEDPDPLERSLDFFICQPLAGKEIALLNECGAGDFWIVEEIHCSDDLKNLNFGLKSGL